MNHSLSKPMVLLAITSFLFLGIKAQQSVGIGTDFPDPHASLEISSVSTGTLITRMTTGQRNANILGLNTTSEGLLIYNLTDSEFNYWDGTQWLAFPGGDDDWYEDGTPPSPPDNISDAIFTNGTVGIGINVPTSSFHIANISSAMQSIRVEDLSQTGDAYNPSAATVSLVNRATVFVDKTNGIMYSEDANRAFWRLDGNSGVVNAGYSGSCPNLISGSMNASGYEYVGTNDNTDFIIATNDRERLRVLRDGQLVAYGKGVVTPASSPTGCVPAYPVIDAASFYATGYTYPLNAYSENVPAIYGTATDVSGGFAANPCGVQGVITNYGYGTMGISTNASSGLSVGLYGEEVSLNGWGLVVVGDALITGTGFGFWSDERLKKDIQPLSAGIDVIMELEPKSFSFKEEFYEYGVPREERMGFIAQEIKAILPGLIMEKDVPGPVGEKGVYRKKRNDMEGYLSMEYTGLIPILTKAIQDQQSQIEELKAENEDIRDRLIAMEAKLFTPPPGTED